MAELKKNVTKSAQKNEAAETKVEEKPVEINKETEMKEEVKPVAKKETAKRTRTAAAKKETAKKTPAAKKETAKKTPAAKKGTAKKTAAAKKEPVAKRPYTTRRPSKVEVTLELGGNSHTQDSLVQSAKDVWVYDLNRDLKDFKTLELYIKPEDHAVYYVVNGEVTGSFAL